MIATFHWPLQVHSLSFTLLGTPGGDLLRKAALGFLLSPWVRAGVRNGRRQPVAEGREAGGFAVQSSAGRRVSAWMCSSAHSTAPPSGLSRLQFVPPFCPLHSGCGDGPSGCFPCPLLVPLHHGYTSGNRSQSCPTLCDPVDFIVRGIFQARILEWVAFPCSRRSSQPRDRTQVSRIAGGFFTSWATREAQEYWSG